VTNLVTEIAKEITDNAIFPQPELSLAASIAAVGTIMGHSFRTETDLRTNMYVFSVSESGTGKDHPRKYIQRLFKDCGLRKRIRGKAGSGSGLVGALYRANGVLLLQTDEMGKELENLNSARAGVYLREIPTLFTELFSTANGYYYDKDLSNRDGKMEPRDIDQPCLSINGSTVPSALYGSMSSIQTFDGFLSRFIPFEGDPMVKPIDGKGIYKIDKDLVQRIKDVYMIGRGVSVDEYGDMDFSEDIIDPKIIYMDKPAKELFVEFREKMDGNKREEIKNGTGLNGIWSRATEHCSKMALIGHDIDKGVVDLNSMEWSINMITEKTEFLIKAAQENISDNDVEARKKKILSIIKDYPRRNGGGYITKRDLTRRTPSLNPKERKDCLYDLKESGNIEEVPVIVGDSTKKTIFYK